MLMCSNALILGGFLFLVAHLMRIFGFSIKFKTPIKGLQGNGFYCATGWF